LEQSANKLNEKDADFFILQLCSILLLFPYSSKQPPTPLLFDLFLQGIEICAGK